MLKSPYWKNDFLSSLSLLLVSLPLSAGIAVASGASPEAGIIAAFFGALIFGFFSSTHLVVYGPAAGLSVFLATGTKTLGGFSQVSASIFIAGLILLCLSFVNIQKLIMIIPRSVIKGMVSGIGIILILKMIPHLLGYDRAQLFDEEFSSGKSNTLLDIIEGFENILPGAVFISGMSFLVLGLLYLAKKKNQLNFTLSSGIVIVSFGVILNLLHEAYFPHLYLQGEHLLQLDSTRIRFKSFFPLTGQWKEIIKTSFFISLVIIIEGFITLDIIQKFDPQIKKLNQRKELLLLGISNCLMGCIGALPIMPVLIRSRANISFGAKTKNSIIIHGLLLAVALFYGDLFSYIPMASVAVTLTVIGLGLLDLKELKRMVTKGLDHYLPYFLTIGFILFFNLFWGVISGFVLGLIFSLKSSFQRSMVLVSDESRYLLKFHKDVTFVHKAELRELLESIPPGKEILIDGTGNIFIDSEIEDWLEDFAEECQQRGEKLTFFKSRLAVSKIFKEL